MLVTMETVLASVMLLWSVQPSQQTSEPILVPDAHPMAPVCLEPVSTGQCRAAIPMWYYDNNTRTCNEFIYGGCPGTANKFTNREACLHKCQPDICFLPAVTGPCRASIPNWHYDPEHRICRPFNYGGCEGNQNRFPTEQRCLTACGGANIPCALGTRFETVGWKAITSDYRHTESFAYRCEGRCRLLCVEDQPWGTCVAFSIRRRWYRCDCYLFDRFLSDTELVSNSRGIARNRQCDSKLLNAFS